jgi:hypothetical protein
LNIGDIVKKWLKDNNFDGLANPEVECGCEVDDLMPCGLECCHITECEAALKKKTRDTVDEDLTQEELHDRFSDPDEELLVVASEKEIKERAGHLKPTAIKDAALETMKMIYGPAIVKDLNDRVDSAKEYDEIVKGLVRP